MRVLHAYNLHRGIGGSDSATVATIAALRHGGVEVVEFARDSRTIPLNLRGKLTAFASGLYAASAVREFAHRLERERPDAVHVHELYPLVSPWILPECTRAAVPVVMSCYDFRLSCPVATHHSRGEACYRCVGGREYWCVLRNCRASLPESLAYGLRNASARKFHLYTDHVDRFIAISDFQRRFLVEKAGLQPQRVVLNPCVIDLPERAVDDPSLGAYVGYAGRFVQEKGVEVMIEACRRARLPMRFAGNAPQHPAVRPDDRAEFVMTRSSEDLARFYRGARVIVVPSLWGETFGLVAAEAMSHGIPVIASRIGALPETVRDGETGMLIGPGNVDELAACLRRLWNDAELARALGRGARRHVEREYSKDAHVARLEAIYRDAMVGAAVRGAQRPPKARSDGASA